MALSGTQGLCSWEHLKTKASKIQPVLGSLFGLVRIIWRVSPVQELALLLHPSQDGDRIEQWSWVTAHFFPHLWETSRDSLFPQWTPSPKLGFYHAVLPTVKQAFHKRALCSPCPHSELSRRFFFGHSDSSAQVKTPAILCNCRPSLLAEIPLLPHFKHFSSKAFILWVLHHEVAVPCICSGQHFSVSSP